MRRNIATASSILDAGRTLAEGKPAEIRAHATTSDGAEPTMEDAFIAIVEASARDRARAKAGAPRERNDAAFRQHAPSNRGADPQGDAAGLPRPKQHRGRHRMPIMLLVLFGYGLSFDVKNVPVALVMEDSSADAMGAVSGFKLSDYFDAAPVKTMAEAERLLLDQASQRDRSHPARFRPPRSNSATAEIQVVVHGTDANTARISLGYAQGAIGTWIAREAARGRLLSARRSSSRTGCGSTKRTRAPISSSRDSSCW